jgi:hypothetical protein
MQTAPAVTYPLAASWVYRCAVGFFAIILIAAHALFYWANGGFNTSWALLCVTSLLVTGWAAYDAFNPMQGDLRFADGQWVLARAGHEAQGTLQPYIDLQHYLLVRFTEQSSHTTTWLHLEHHTVPKITKKVNHTNLHANADTQAAAWLWAHHWMDVRRAVYSRSQPPVTHEQPIP